MLTPPVPHPDEIRHKRAAGGLANGCKALVMPHHGHENGLGQNKVGRIKLATQWCWVFTQPCKFVQQIVAQFDFAADLGGQLDGATGNQRSSLGRINQYRGSAQRVDIARGALDMERCRKEKAMAPAHADGIGQGSWQARKLNPQRLISEEAKQPTDWPDKGEVVLAPAHVAGKLHRGQNFWQRLQE